MDEVLKRIDKEDITLNKDTCIFGTESITYLRHEISSKDISIDPDRISCLKKFPEPKNRKKGLQFLGMINFSNQILSQIK